MTIKPEKPEGSFWLTNLDDSLQASLTRITGDFDE
jgi:hypothetical protein